MREDWRGLYWTGAVAASLTAILVPMHIAAFVAWPPPLEGTALDWFHVFQSNELIGLVSMDLVLVFDYVLLLPIFLALYASLRERSPSLVSLGVAAGLAAMAIYLASNPMVEMLALSRRHVAAASEEERALLVAAGQATVERYQGTAFHASYILGSLAGIFVSWPMLRTPGFGRVAAWAGILGNVVGFGLYLPVVGLLLGVLSGPLLWVWYILVARGLFRFATAREGKPTPG